MGWWLRGWETASGVLETSFNLSELQFLHLLTVGIIIAPTSLKCWMTIGDAAC